jgi:hypothetical protein
MRKKVQIASDHSHPLCSGFHNHRHDLRAEILITESVLHQVRSLFFEKSTWSFRDNVSASLPRSLLLIARVFQQHHICDLVQLFSLCCGSVFTAADCVVEPVSLGYPCPAHYLPKAHIPVSAKILRFRHLEPQTMNFGLSPALSQPTILVPIQGFSNSRDDPS